jgi:hypothetical protein
MKCKAYQLFENKTAHLKLKIIITLLLRFAVLFNFLPLHDVSEKSLFPDPASCCSCFLR